MRNHQRDRRTEVGVMLLISYLISNSSWIPTVTLGTIILQVLIYTKTLILPFVVKNASCISGANILYNKRYSLLWTSALQHGDDMHLYYNMTSLTIKGRYLENKYGPVNFALLLISLVFLSSSFYVANAYCFYLYYDEEYSQLRECAVGFSGVLFALKVIVTREKPSDSYSVLGLPVPSWAAAWAELVLISVMVPNASFKGHLAGILAGLMYTDTPLGSLVDALCHMISGKKLYHNFRRTFPWGVPSFFHPFSYRSSSSSTSSSSSYYRSESSYRREGRPPRYGFVYEDNSDWEYDYNPR